ncbi:pyridoxal phosphate-dependent aminotransferase [Dysosmobacter sp.]
MDLIFNQAVTQVELSGIRQFTYMVRDTPGACALTIGEPDLNTPEVIKEAAKAALDANDTHYPPGNGCAYLLEAISQYEARAHGLHYAPGEIIMTVGATEALFASLSTILNPGDEVILPTPAFGLYEALVRLRQGVPVALPTQHSHFQIVPEELAAAITPKTKAIVLTSPNNPTGCMYTKDTLDAIHEILKDRPIFVLCDDVYRALVYTQGYHSFAEYADMRDRIIVIQSFSKPYAMTGWRLGYCMADAPVMDRIQVFHQYAVTSIPSFVQRACVTALQTPTDDVVDIFRKRRDYVYKRLVDMGLKVEKPEGAFYMFIDIQKFGMDSVTFCTRMLKEGLVGVIPGIHFGAEGYMRLSYCYSDADLKEGLDRIEAFIKKLSA